MKLALNLTLLEVQSMLLTPEKWCIAQEEADKWIFSLEDLERFLEMIRKRYMASLTQADIAKRAEENAANTKPAKEPEPTFKLIPEA